MLNQYPYLVAALLLALLAALGAALWPAERKGALLSGLLCLPFALFSFEYIPRYWNPQVTAFFICSPEDLLFSFSTGALAWLLASAGSAWAVLRPRLDGALLLRYLGWSALGIGTGYAVCFAFPGTQVMLHTLCGIVLTGTLMFLYARPAQRLRLLRLGLSGAWRFTLLYGLVFWLLLRWQPHFADDWALTQELPARLIGVPAYELVWALGFGFVWPVFVAVVASGGARTCSGRTAAKS